MDQIVDRLNAGLAKLAFASPVTHVYNPLDYARAAFLQYASRYGQGTKRVVLVGMNPGPWGMAQTGVPFGEVSLVRDWLKIDAPIERPTPEHPARPVLGLACARSEVSGRRLWGCLQEIYGDPERFFEIGFVANYCPLMFMEESGVNRTPDKLPKSEREPLLTLCDRALADLLELQRPELIVGVGKWAAERARLVAPDRKVVSIAHPSPANPAANRGWGNELRSVLEGL